MLIPLSQALEWAAMKPPVGISARAKLAWRRFVPIELEGQRLAFPVKAALAWMRATGAESMTYDGMSLRGQLGGSRIALNVYAACIPCEEPYDARVTNGGGGAISEHCEWLDMTANGKTCSTPEERKEANHAKRLDKAKADLKAAKKELDKHEKQVAEAQEIVAQPLADAVKQARIYLSVLRARRAYEADPTVFPLWMPETCEREHFDCATQESVTKTHKTREIHTALVANYRAALADKDAYTPPRRWPSYYTAKDKKENPDMGMPVYGPKWDKLNQAVGERRRELARFVESQFREYVKANNWPDELGWGNVPRAYSQARQWLKKWPALQADLSSRVTEAAQRLERIEPGWQYWQKEDKASLIHASDAEGLTKARELGATGFPISQA